MIFNGINFEEFGYVEFIRRPLLPSITLNSMKNPGRPGSDFQNIEVGNSTIEVDYRFVKKNRKDLDAFSSELAGLIFTNEPQKLYLRDSPGKYNMAILQGDTTNHKWLHTGFVTFTFECPDPFLYNDILKQESVGVGTILNEGNYKCYGVMTITLTQSISKIVIKHIQRNETITIDHEFDSGDIITIDLLAETARLNDILWLEPYLDSDFFPLDPGDNTITLSSGHGVVEFRERWWS
ncbi:MAG TPA: distal tail protein Dit [Clostridia bacterium]|nr:distal tail protein Dit [Clostridia bacterium]